MKSIINLFAVLFLLLANSQCSVQTSENTAIKTFFVSAEQRDCTAGAGKMKCMLVKEKPDAQWQNFYSRINGFSYEPGYEYILTVATEKIENPPADASSIKYTLVKEISKIKK